MYFTLSNLYLTIILNNSEQTWDFWGIVVFNVVRELFGDNVIADELLETWTDLPIEEVTSLAKSAIVKKF